MNRLLNFKQGSFGAGIHPYKGTPEFFANELGVNSSVCDCSFSSGFYKSFANNTSICTAFGKKNNILNHY